MSIHVNRCTLNFHQSQIWVTVVKDINDWAWVQVLRVLQVVLLLCWDAWMMLDVLLGYCGVCCPCPISYLSPPPRAFQVIDIKWNLQGGMQEDSEVVASV